MEYCNSHGLFDQLDEEEPIGVCQQAACVAELHQSGPDLKVPLPRNARRRKSPPEFLMAYQSLTSRPHSRQM